MRLLCVCILFSLGSSGCATPNAQPNRYRLGSSAWEDSGSGVPEDLRARYAEFFAIVLDPETTHEPPLRQLRDDLERTPVTRNNFDALNSLAIAYFTYNERAESKRGGPGYLQGSFGSAKLVAVPWRAYGATDDGALREAILDFFADIARGTKPGSRRTASRLVPVVRSLESKESDPGRRSRIQRIAERLAPPAP